MKTRKRIPAQKAAPSEAIITGTSAGLIFKLADAAARLGVSESTLKRGWPTGEFPAPVRLTSSGTRIGWLEREILRYQNEKAAERDAALAKKSSGVR
jgi:predicted DNA-binding transcriptional regulator AlpA